jgi:hypothetical protein
MSKQKNCNNHPDRRLFVVLRSVLFVFFTLNLTIMYVIAGLKAFLSALFIVLALIVFVMAMLIPVSKNKKEPENVFGYLAFGFGYVFYFHLLMLFTLIYIAVVFGIIDKYIPDPPVPVVSTASVIPELPRTP